MYVCMYIYTYIYNIVFCVARLDHDSKWLIDDKNDNNNKDDSRIDKSVA